MEKIDVIGKSREEARKIITKLARKQQFQLNTLLDGSKVYIETSGRKTSKVNGIEVKDLDFKVFCENTKKLNYIDDLLLDVYLKEQVVGKEKIARLVEAIKKAIELEPIEKIHKEIPELKEIEKIKVGHSVDFLLKVIPILALQEDVNYWGMKPSGKEKYEGREKPYNALVDFIIKEQRLFDVIKKHRLVIVFMG